MPEARPRLLTVAVACALVTLLLTGCSTNTTPEPAEGSQSSASLKETFSGVMPPLLITLSEGADMGYKRVCEESCLSHEVDDSPGQ